MPQIAEDIISRVAWEIGDESFEIIKMPEMIKALDRVYRDYCHETKILTNTIGFLGDGTNNEFDMYGTVIGSSTIFGDNFFKLYRVTYQGHRAEERDFEYIQNKRSHTSAHPDENTTHHHHVVYAIKYLGKYQRMYFTFVLPDQSEVILWYYEYPKLGTISNKTDTFSIDDKNTDDLIIGLKVWGLKKLIIHYAKQGFAEKINKDIESKYVGRNITILQILKSELKEAQESWKILLLERGREVSSYREEVTPIVMEVGEPFEADISSTWEQDFSGFDEI